VSEDRRRIAIQLMALKVAAGSTMRS
jgi:hypothetical protein